MPSDIENLWGDIPLARTMERTPVTILKEQATVLGESTENVLQGRITHSPVGSEKFKVNLSIVAPTLGNYSYDVVNVSYPIGFYPLFVSASGFPTAKCKDETEFKNVLSDILKSAETKSVIQRLLNHILTETSSPTN